jgi:predicted nucleic acid-binding protein
MTVVSNTSPINYLTLIGLGRLLPALFRRVIIPLAVEEELKSPARRLKSGEKEAIGLAVKMKADLNPFWMKPGGGGQHLCTLVCR